MNKQSYDFSYVINEIMKRNNLGIRSLEKIANKNHYSGLSFSMIQRYRKGQNYPSQETINSLAMEFNYDPRELQKGRECDFTKPYQLSKEEAKDKTIDALMDSMASLFMNTLIIENSAFLEVFKHYEELNTKYRRSSGEGIFDPKSMIKMILIKNMDEFRTEHVGILSNAYIKRLTDIELAEYENEIIRDIADIELRLKFFEKECPDVILETNAFNLIQIDNFRAELTTNKDEATEKWVRNKELKNNYDLTSRMKYENYEILAYIRMIKDSRKGNNTL